jgi:uncharacterized membrane protein YgcG
MKTSLLTVTFLAVLSSLSDAEDVIPLKPDRYFNDYASVVSKEAAHRFDEQLAQFERETSDQVVVAVFPKMQSDSDIADYTQRVAQAWGVGQKERPNGVVLFLFMQDRKMFIRVGYGLEGALSDATAFDITEYHIKPLFQNGDYQGGLATGIDLICKAIRGEYTGSGKTLAEQRGNARTPPERPKEVQRMPEDKLIEYSQGKAPSLVFWICYTVYTILIIAAWWKIFSKAGQPGWAAIIPIYNLYVWCKIVGRPWWWILLMLIPFVNFIILIILLIDLAKSFGKGVGFAIGLILLSVIFFPILGFGSATYEGLSMTPKV